MQISCANLWERMPPLSGVARFSFELRQPLRKYYSCRYFDLCTRLERDCYEKSPQIAGGRILEEQSSGHRDIRLKCWQFGEAHHNEPCAQHRASTDKVVEHIKKDKCERCLAVYRQFLWEERVIWYLRACRN